MKIVKCAFVFAMLTMGLIMKADDSNCYCYKGADYKAKTITNSRGECQNFCKGYGITNPSDVAYTGDW